MGVGGNKVLDTVGLAHCHPSDAATAAPLGAIDAVGDALDVTSIGHRDQHIQLRDEVFVTDLTVGIDDPCPTRIAVGFLQVCHVVLDQLEDLVRAGKQVLQPGNLLQQFTVLVLDLLALQRREPAELHIEDRGCLDLAEAEPLHEVVPGALAGS